MRVVLYINYIPFLHIMYTESVQRTSPFSFSLRFIFRGEKSEMKINDIPIVIPFVKFKH